MELIVAPPTSSPARVDPPVRGVLTVGLVQTRWHADPDEHAATLLDGVAKAASAGAEVVFLPELTLSRYPADTRPSGDATATAEDLATGPTRSLAAKAAADTGAYVHASLFERAPEGDGLGYNTAILVAPDGSLAGRRRKTHIPRTAGYYEDHYFRPGPADADALAPVDLGGKAKVGLPTCWDEWFPEVARAYALAGADLIAYPTAIGSEPDHPDFDTAPLWRQVIVGHGIANGTFMVVPNRWGSEGLITFYGGSFISDPYGRVLAEAPRAGDAVLVAPLDLDQRRDWLTLFPFFATRRPDLYGPLTAPVDPVPRS
ncbi:nitrilase-related carbon-nitrogen hydrolase [Actinocorallia sp. A-T 12471]|uniref:nitrilase-related carbon-nitrogen hydrolase n=1 Tax=Actinocorallia sp. A-T 12471 TaxID=3089813 RepID=UPI0029CB4DA1|nr:nitrilase-related carbon-nitrogen hydrolase [Actinocorallia sp. A-T 12471]MDX6740869.1 nitrilase-related carbon-nitrogen hydrolase [Actinocorallia sp. A-T 12471]